MKKLIAILLCLIMLLALSACGKDKQETPEISLEADIETPFFTSQTLEKPSPDITFEAAVGAGESIILLGTDSERERRLYRMDTGLFSFTAIECSIPGTLETMDGLDDGSAVMSYYDESGALIICQIAPDNSVNKSTLNLPQELEGTLIFDLKAVESGYLFTAYEGSTLCLYTVDRQGTLLSRTAYRDCKGLYILRRQDDSLAVVSSKDDETLVQELDGKQSVLNEYSIGTELVSFVNGGGSGEIIGVMPLGKACFVQLDTGDLRGYANLANGRINQRSFIPLSDTEFFAISNGEAAVWTKSEEQERIALRMQTIDYDSIASSLLKSAVNDFNNSDGKYYIELVDYGVYGEQAEKMLTADIVAGNTPDIYDMNCLSGANCYANGLMADLMPFFQADPDINYEDIIAGVRSVIQQDNAVYDLIPQFSVSTMFAPATIVGEEKFTVDSMLALAEEYGTEALFGECKSRDRLLLEAIIYCGDFIDEREASCSFDSPDFIKLLELAKTLPEEANGMDYMAVYRGEALLYRTPVEGLCVTEGLSEIEALYHGDWRAVGFPSAEGTGVTLTPWIRLGMSSNSQHQDGVWAFFKYLLSDRYQWNIKRGMPVIADVLEQNMNGQIQLGTKYSLGMFSTDENGQIIPESLAVGPPTEELKARLWKLLDSIDGINEYDPALLTIVENEADRFFAGNCTAQEAAANIQSRASVYMSEQFG